MRAAFLPRREPGTTDPTDTQEETLIMHTPDPIITGISDMTAPYAAHLALSDMPAPIADAMLALARRCAATLVAQGWQAEPSAYDLGAFHGDEEALDDALDRRSTLDERVSFESAVRATLAVAVEQ